MSKKRQRFAVAACWLGTGNYDGREFAKELDDNGREFA
jgi:hypothetical protein